MVDMGMGEDKGIDAAPLAETLAVKFKSLLAFTLEKSAVKHDTIAVDVNEML